MVRESKSETNIKRSADKLIAFALIGTLACGTASAGFAGRTEAFAADSATANVLDAASGGAAQDSASDSSGTPDTPDTPPSPIEPSEPTTPDTDPVDPDPGTGEDVSGDGGQLPPDDENGEDKVPDEIPPEELPGIIEELPPEEETTEDLPSDEYIPDVFLDEPSFASGILFRDSAANYPRWSYSGDTSYTPIHYTGDISEEKFVATIAEQARQIAQDYDLYASVMIAQAVLESNSGAVTNFNLFNIKELPNGSAMLPGMSSSSNSKYSKEDARNRSYSSLTESLEDYAKQIAVDRRYYFRDALKSNTDSWQDAALCMQDRYSESDTYAQNIADVIQAYDLTRFDTPLPFETVDPLKKRHYDEHLDRDVYEDATLADLAAEAVSHLGTPYVFGGSDPATGLDCSGFVQVSYRDAFGIELPRTTHYQCLEGEDVDFKDLHVGDLLFFVDGAGIVYHVGMYLTDGYYIESYNESVGNVLTVFEERKPQFAKRLIPTKDLDITHNSFESNADLTGFKKKRPGGMTGDEIMERIRESVRSMDVATQEQDHSSDMDHVRHLFELSDALTD